MTLLLRMRPLRSMLLVLLLLAPCPALAGPWSKSWGEVYVKLGESLFLADSYVDASGQVVQGTEYLGAATFVYFEVGVWDGLMAWGYLPYLVAQNSFDDGSRYLTAGGGDALLGLQYSPKFLNLPLPLAVRLAFKVPLYDVGGNAADPLATRYPAAGDGQLDVTFWLSAGGSVPGIPLYFFGEVGVRHRTEHYVGAGDDRELGDGFTFAAQVGYTIRHRLLVAVTTGGVVPLSSDEVTKGYVTVGPVLALLLPHGLSLEATVDPIAWARNASQGVGLSLGLSFKR